MLPPVWRLVKSVALVRCRWLRAPSCLFLFSGGGKWAKRVLNGENSLMVSKGFKDNFGRGRMLIIMDME